MSKIYSKAPSGVAERAAHLVKVFHTDIFNAGVKIDLISVADDDPEVEYPLKVRGIAAYATCRAVDIKGRTMGRGDAEIVIDEGRYLTQSDATKDAILDHEIEHVELKLTKKGRVKLDCLGRPQIKMRMHDFDCGWFESIAERHGRAAIECRQAAELYRNHIQTYFAFVATAPVLESSGGGIKDAVKDFVDKTQASGISVTLSHGQNVVTIDKDGVHGRTGKAVS